MQIYMDADACPKPVKEILFRAVKRVGVKLIMVANKEMRIPDSKNISLVIVDDGPDVADNKIAELVQVGDLIVTADIPLADRAVEKGAFALDPRGTFHTVETIKHRLAVRNLMDHLRSSGLPTSGPAAFNIKDRQAFANQLDKFLATHSWKPE